MSFGPLIYQEKKKLLIYETQKIIHIRDQKIILHEDVNMTCSLIPELTDFTWYVLM
jgi:hypothetical protein